MCSLKLLLSVCTRTQCVLSDNHDVQTVSWYACSGSSCGTALKNKLTLNQKCRTISATSVPVTDFHFLFCFEGTAD